MVQILSEKQDDVKALYKRGTAYNQVGKLEAAEDDLRKAEKLNPGGMLLPLSELGDHDCYCTDKLVKQQMETVQKKKLEQKEKDRKMYAAMFSST